MIRNADLRLWLVNDQIARDHRHAADVRLADQARHRHRIPLRLRAARQLIKLGERLAAEPALRPTERLAQ